MADHAAVARDHLDDAFETSDAHTANLLVQAAHVHALLDIADAIRSTKETR